MGALNVMKQVGYEWQNITEEKKQYFQNKADTDKARYIRQMAEFYDEVERIGDRKDKVDVDSESDSQKNESDEQKEEVVDD